MALWLITHSCRRFIHRNLVFTLLSRHSGRVAPQISCSPMPRQQQTVRRICFVGDESQGIQTCHFTQAIDPSKVYVGAEVSIMHQNSLNAACNMISSDSVAARPVILQGKVLSIRRVNRGVVTLTAGDECRGGLTEVGIPVAYSTIGKEGGWHTKVKPLWEQRGLMLRYLIRVWTHDLRHRAEKKSRPMRDTTSTQLVFIGMIRTHSSCLPLLTPFNRSHSWRHINVFFA